MKFLKYGFSKSEHILLTDSEFDQAFEAWARDRNSMVSSTHGADKVNLTRPPAYPSGTPPLWRNSIMGFYDDSLQSANRFYSVSARDGGLVLSVLLGERPFEYWFRELAFSPHVLVGDELDRSREEEVKTVEGLKRAFEPSTDNLVYRYDFVKGPVFPDNCRLRTFDDALGKGDIPGDPLSYCFTEESFGRKPYVRPDGE